MFLLLLTVCMQMMSFTDAFSFANKILTGKVTDKSTGAPLQGVSVYFPDLKTGAITKPDGTYRISNLPASKTLIRVSLIGYKMIAEIVDLSDTDERNFEMEEAIIELNDIIVTGQTRSTEKDRSPSPISILSAEDLAISSSENIIDAIAKVPGVSQVTTGTSIAKPVIRGLGYNRVLVINDGVRQEGQQWGDEHGIEVDEYSVNNVEILKGPASLSYGSDALAGVVNLLTAPTLPAGSIKGNVLANYQTNNGLIGGSLNLAGNSSGFIWDLRYSNKLAHSYKNKYDGYVYNSGFKENSLSGILGFNKSWGFSHLHFGMYNIKPGIVEGDRDSATGKFVTAVTVNDTTSEEEIVNEDQLKSYNPSVPYQKVHHYKAILNNSFIVGKGNLNAIVGWQQNQRQEFADPLEPEEYELYFLLNTYSYDFRYNLPEKKGLNFSFGVNGMYQDNKNKSVEFLIPDYNLFDFGAYAILSKRYKDLDLSGGFRFDTRSEDGKQLYLDDEGIPVQTPDSNAVTKFEAFSSNFTGFSASVGLAYQLSKNSFTKFNISKGFRAPNIAELASKGIHEGTVNYEIGDPNLKPENSLQFDLGFGANTEHVSVEASLFYNYISNYIYTRKLAGTNGQDSLTDGFSTYKFTSGDADIYGGELSIDIHPHPLDWLHFENTLSLVRSIQRDQPDSSKYLPKTPAPRFTSELRVDFKKPFTGFANLYAKLNWEAYFRQDKVFYAFGTETETPGYNLFNAGIGTDIVSGNRNLFSVYIAVNNITDVAYQNHLSRLKYAPENFATGRTGVYNMGRNFSFKLMVPIEFSE